MAGVTCPSAGPAQRPFFLLCTLPHASDKWNVSSLQLRSPGGSMPRLRPCLGGAHCTGSIGTTTPSTASTTSPASRHRSSRKRGARICTPGRRRPVVADRHRKRRNPQQRANVAMLKAGGKCSGFVRDRASRSRPQMSSAKSAGGVAHSREAIRAPSRLPFI